MILEELITAYKYWLNKCVLSSSMIDVHKKSFMLRQLMEQVNQQGISKDELEKRLAR